MGINHQLSGEGCSICIPVIRNIIVRLHVIFDNQYGCHLNPSNLSQMSVEYCWVLDIEECWTLNGVAH